MTDDEWTAAIKNSQSQIRPHTTAETFVNRLRSASQPVVVVCGNGETYHLKAMQPANAAMPWVATAEQVVGRIGTLIGAPVPDVRHVDVPQDLVNAEPEMSHMTCGLAHGSRTIPNTSDKLGVQTAGSQRNREAYSALGVLYGWTVAGDPQLIRTMDAAQDVYSVDHGYFFPGGPNWNAGSLGGREAARPDQQFLVNGAEPNKVDEAIVRAKGVTDAQLAGLIGSSCPAWGVPLTDLVALAKFLSHRRDTMST